jgi:hypothetical protein
LITRIVKEAEAALDKLVKLVETSAN